MKSLACVVLGLLLTLEGCTPKGSSPDAVREHAADATAEFKRDAKAVAKGVQEGWTRDSSVDINSASTEQLETLSGVTPKVAELIVSGIIASLNVAVRAELMGTFTAGTPGDESVGTVAMTAGAVGGAGTVVNVHWAAPP